MDDQQWRAAFDLLQQAECLPAGEREAFVRSQASDDPAVLELVLSVIVGDELDRPSDQPRSGTRFGQYEIQRRLGRGGTGSVYAALDLDLGRLVALKFLTPELIAQHGSRKRLMKEAQAASLLNHPNIITIYEVVRSGSEIAIAMELIQGDTLRHYCSAAQPHSTVAEWGRQISGALAAAHENGIIHCDVKPENLLLRADGVVKVVDFGLARRIIPSASTESISLAAGTFDYFAPEQVAGNRPVTASDVFALGIVLYELAAGNRPFRGETPFDTLHAIAHDMPERPSLHNAAIPASMDQLILEMLEKEPAARPKADAVAQALSEPLAMKNNPRPESVLARAARLLARRRS